MIKEKRNIDTFNTRGDYLFSQKHQNARGMVLYIFAENVPIEKKLIIPQRKVILENTSIIFHLSHGYIKENESKGKNHFVS